MDPRSQKRDLGHTSVFLAAIGVDLRVFSTRPRSGNMIQAVIATWYNNIRSANGTVDSNRLITCRPRATTKALVLMVPKTKSGTESRPSLFCGIGVALPGTPGQSIGDSLG